MKPFSFLRNFTLVALSVFLPITGSVAQTYTATQMLLENGWSLEFEDNSRLFFSTKDNALLLKWEPGNSGIDLPNAEVTNTQNFVTEDDFLFEQWSVKRYNEEARGWNAAKIQHDKAEEARFKKETLEYEEKVAKAEDDYQAALKKWKKEKIDFENQAQQEYEKRLAEWEVDKQAARQEYDQELADYQKELAEDPDCEKAMFRPCRKPQAPKSTAKPELDKFREKIPKKIIIDPVQPIQNFNKPKPIKITDPAYDLLSLLVKLGRGVCDGNFRVAMSEEHGEIHWGEARSTRSANRSPFRGKTGRCELIDRESGQQLAAVEMDQQRITAIETAQGTLHLKRIVSPSLIQFEKELQQRMWSLSKLDFRKEPIDMEYRLKSGSASVYVTYEFSKGISKQTTTLPEFLLDPQVEDQSRQITWVEFFKDSVLQDWKLPTVVRFFSHPPSQNPEQSWLVFANASHFIAKKRVFYELKFSNRGDKTPTEALNENRFVTSLTGVSYLAARTATFKREVPLAIFENAVLLNGSLNPRSSGGDTLLDFKVGQGQRAIYHVSSNGIVVEIELRQLGDSLVLQDATTPTIRKNREWKQQFVAQHKLQRVR